MSSLVEQIKARLSIEEVVGAYLKLEKAGSTLRARCPFHNEKTASFFVSVPRNSFYCFGCNKGGDIFTFVEEIEGVDFKGALATLATRAGLEVEAFHESREEVNEKTTLKRVMETAAEFFVAKLHEYPAARTYLQSRGLTDDTIKLFRIGYAPDNWRAVYDHLKSRGYQDAQLVQAGLCIQSERGYYDRFRHRLMFPMADAQGAVVAFSGRLAPGVAETAGKEPAKYINSPETPLYNKSSFLYGYDKAKVSIRKSDAAVLVEGQMDLVMSHQAGVANAVAVSGTALTPLHLQMLSRLSHTMIIAFDQDVAGFNAARRGIEMALTHGLSVRIALVPHAKDPADLVRESPQLWRDTVSAAEPVIDALLATITSRRLEAHERRRTVEAEILPYVSRLVSKLDQAHYVRMIAEFLDLNEDAVWAQLRAQSNNIPTSKKDQPPDVLIQPRWTRMAKKLYGILLWQQPSPPAWLAETEARLRALLDPSRMEVLAPDEDSRRALIFESELSYQGHTDLERESGHLLRSLEEELLKERLETVMQQLRSAEKRKQQEEIDRYVQECNTISQQLRALMSKTS